MCIVIVYYHIYLIANFLHFTRHSQVTMDFKIENSMKIFLTKQHASSYVWPRVNSSEPQKEYSPMASFPYHLEKKVLYQPDSHVVLVTECGIKCCTFGYTWCCDIDLLREPFLQLTLEILLCRLCWYSLAWYSVCITI